MKKAVKSFDAINFSVGVEKTKISIIDIQQIDSSLKLYMDEYFVRICEGDSASSIKQVKNRLLRFLEKKDMNTRMGATAEFFVHLYLGTLQFKQDCLFLNLEENSIKKGFDGNYTKNGESWLMESKSGAHSSSQSGHCLKIGVAYTDLVNKLAGKASNNPWQNAYNHASHIDVRTKKDIRDQLKKLSDDYSNGIFYKTIDFNIIPCATVFMDGIWKMYDKKALAKRIFEIVKKFKYKDIRVICITKKSVDLFVNYLRI